MKEILSAVMNCFCDHRTCLTNISTMASGSEKVQCLKESGFVTDFYIGCLNHESCKRDVTRPPNLMALTT